jgi:hypothetical protein
MIEKIVLQLFCPLILLFKFFVKTMLVGPLLDVVVHFLFEYSYENDISFYESMLEIKLKLGQFSIVYFILMWFVLILFIELTTQRKLK